MSLSQGSSELLQLKIANRLIQFELARRRTLDFAMLTKPDWITAPHHHLLCEVADRVISHDLKRVAISLPPRHTKSEIFSIRLAARYLGVHPDRQILHISYASALSNTFSMQVRALVRDNPLYHELFPATVLDPDRQRLDDWKTTLGGGFKSIGVGGGVTGFGAHLILIDDPQKEGDEQSMTVMQQIFEWYLSAARTRLYPDGAIAIIMTRWHPSDLIGRVLDAGKESPDADQFETVVLPALAGKDDLLGREEGEALWPERYSRANLLAIKALSERYFEALFQQNPQPEGSKLFFAEDFRRDLYFMDGRAAWAFDLAISEDDTADYSCWGRWEFDKASGWLQVSQLNRKRQEWPQTKADILALMREYPDDVFVFPKHTYELMAVLELRASTGDYANLIEQVSMTGDKRERAAVYSDICANGRAIVEQGEMGDLFIREHDRFPDVHDDFVDMSSVAAHYFFGTGQFDFLVGVQDGHA